MVFDIGYSTVPKNATSSDKQKNQRYSLTKAYSEW